MGTVRTGCGMISRLLTQKTSANEQMADSPQPRMAGQWLLSRKTRAPRTRVVKQAISGNRGIRRISQSSMLPSGRFGADRFGRRRRLVRVNGRLRSVVRKNAGWRQMRPARFGRLLVAGRFIGHGGLIGFSQVLPQRHVERASAAEQDDEQGQRDPRFGGRQRQAEDRKDLSRPGAVKRTEG